MIHIREIAPTIWVIQCPTRGTYATAFTTRANARRGVWTAIEAPPERWIDAKQLRTSLTSLGFVAKPDLSRAIEI